MGTQTRKTIATVLVFAVIAFGAVFRTMGTTSQLIVGGLLASLVIVFTVLLWRTRATSDPDRRTDSTERRAASAGALLALFVIAYGVLFESLFEPLLRRIVAGIALTIFAFAVARACWASWKAAAAAALAMGVVAYGVLFDSISGTGQAIVGAILGLLILVVSMRLSRSPAVAFSAALAYAVVVYRLFFESIDSVGLRTLTAAVLIFAFILIALRWWLYWQYPRARWAAGIITFLSLALVVFTLVRGVDLLGGRQPPRERAEAPAVGFVPPEPAKPGHGFAVGMGVKVETCDEPVHVTLVVAGTAEYWHDNPEGSGPFKLGIPGTLINPAYGLSWGSTTVTNPMDARLPMDARVRYRKWKDDPVQNMTTVSGHLPAIRRGYGVEAPSVVAKFDAMEFDDERNWLEARGQGTCYVRLPALSGNFTAFAAEQAAGRAYRPRMFPQQLLVRRRGECVPQVSERKYHGKLAALYCPEAEIVHGSAAVRVTSQDEGQSAGEVLADESLPEPDTVVEGDPVWSCRSDPRGEDKRRSGLELSEARLGFALSTDRLVRETAPNCSGFVAVSEADADERRDVTLILIGIGVALGLGAFIELLMRWVLVEFPLKPRPPSRS